MGKTAKWFRGLLGGGATTSKKNNHPKPTSDATSSSVPSKPQPPRKTNKWSFVGSYRDKQTQPTTTTTAAEKSTGSGRLSAVEREGRMTWREVVAAVRIQAVFRGYLARRALKALRGVVKLQALVRGHITRKKKAEEMRCMQALLRLQSKARANRLSVSEMHHPNSKPLLSQQPGPTTPEKHERTIRSKSIRHSRSSLLKRNSSVSNNQDLFDSERPQLRNDFLDRRIDEHAWDYYCRETQMKYGLMDDNQSNKNVGYTKPDFNTKHQNISAAFNRSSFDLPSKDSTTAHLSSSSVSSGEVQSKDTRRPNLIFPEDETFCTSATSRHSSSKRGPFTPTTTSDSRSFQSLCTDHPNYMSNTESSRAKARSQSAPKQRLEFEKSSSARRYGAHGSGDMRRNMLKASVLQSSFASKGYPGSGRLDRLGVASQHEFSDAYDNRY